MATKVRRDGERLAQVPAHRPKEKEFLQMADRLARDLAGQVKFNKREIVILLKYHWELSCQSRVRKLDRPTFRDVLTGTFGLTDDILADRIFREVDRDNDGVIMADELIRGLSVMLRGTVQEQAKFAFSVYDINRDGSLSREEMFALLKPCLVSLSSEEDAEEGIKELVDLCFHTLKRKIYDGDRDIRSEAKLDAEEYLDIVDVEPLLIEFLGPCLPSEDRKMAFCEKYNLDYVSNSYLNEVKCTTQTAKT